MVCGTTVRTTRHVLRMDRWGPKHVELKPKCWLKLIHWDHTVYLAGLYICSKCPNPAIPVCSVVFHPAHRTNAIRCVHNSRTSVTCWWRPTSNWLLIRYRNTSTTANEQCGILGERDVLDRVIGFREGSQDNGDYSTMQYQLTGFYNREGMCLLRGTNEIFIFNVGLFPLTAESRLRSRASWCQICEDTLAVKQGYLRVASPVSVIPPSSP